MQSKIRTRILDCLQHRLHSIRLAIALANTANANVCANAQPPAIVNAIHDAVGVWVTEMPASPERVLRAIKANAEPRREGKRVIFDEELSLRTLTSNGGAGFLDRP